MLVNISCSNGSKVTVNKTARMFYIPGYEKHHSSPHCIKPVVNEYGSAMVYNQRNVMR